MQYIKKMSKVGNCEGCKNCQHYPYFHYDKDEKGDLIEYTKFNNIKSTVINKNTGITHDYNGEKWILRK